MNDIVKVAIIAVLGYVLYNMYMGETSQCAQKVQRREVAAPAQPAAQVIQPMNTPVQPMVVAQPVVAPQSTQPKQPAQGTESFVDSYPFTEATMNPVVSKEAPIVEPKASMDSNIDMYQPIDLATGKKQSNEAGYVAGDKLTVKDLLPTDTNSIWAESTPTTGSLENVNLLEAGYHIGVNTIGQTLKNANYQIRSDPPVPKFNVGPFNNPTVEYDDNRRPFEIGAA